MDISTALKFVKGAVAKKDYTPSLTHFRIKNGMVLGFNGTLAICSPIEINLDITPKAIEFIKAIEACEGTISLHVTANGKLAVQSLNFRSFVNCVAPENFPEVKPVGHKVRLGQGKLMPALRHLEPFIAEDASRPWACSVLLDGFSAYSTNNIVLLQYWLGWQFPARVSLPAAAVREVIRIGEEPESIQFDERRVIFHYADGRWISTQVVEGNWPDVEGLLNKTSASEPEPIQEGLFSAVEQLLPFADELSRIYFLGDKVSTVADPSVSGSVVAMQCPRVGCYNGKQFLNLKGVADKVSFMDYPSSASFYGKLSRGRIAGIR